MRFRTLVGLAVAAPAVLGAQQADSTASGMSTPAATADSGGSAPHISGTLFSNYMYQTGKERVIGGTPFGGGRNSFNFERAYLNAMAQLSSRTSARATLDIFDPNSLAPGSGIGNVTGYIARLQYGYLQYDYLKGADWNASASVGMLPTVTISHDEQFWPRWIAKSPTELAGFFEIADLGVATHVAMPNKWGEIYAAVTNGPGFTSTSDQDRFKDYQARVTLTPFSSGSGLLSTFDLSAWYYKGSLANPFTGTAGTAVKPLALKRDRWGAFAGVRDPRLTVGLQWAETKDDSATSATATMDTTGRLLSAYTVVHPLASSPVGIVLRYDQVKPNTSSDKNYSVFIGGLTYELSKRASVSADYQELSVHNGAVMPSGVLAAPKAAYMHVVVNY